MLVALRRNDHVDEEPLHCKDVSVSVSAFGGKEAWATECKYLAW